METSPITQESAHKAELMEFASFLASDDERRICHAHQLHKHVAGNLVAALTLLEMLRLESGKTAPGGEEVRLSQRLGEILRETLKEVRWLVEEQYPPLLKSFGLNAALEDLTRLTNAQQDCVMELDVQEEELPLSLSAQLSLFRIAETLFCHASVANAARLRLSLHAHGGLVRMAFSCECDSTHWQLEPLPSALECVLARCKLLSAEVEAHSTQGIPQIIITFPFSSDEA